MAVLPPPVVLLKSARITVGCIVIGRGVAKERIITGRRVGLPAVVAVRVPEAPMAVLARPRVLLKSALAPVAVFWPPAVLRPSAALPVAVFWLPLVLLNMRAITGGRVSFAGGVDPERERSVGRVEVAFGVVRKGERSSGRVFLGNGIV